jgi:branched-subunit amino acid transport protein
MSVWLALAGMAAVTFGLRASLLMLPERIALPPLLARALRYVPAAVLTAIWAPELLLRSGGLYLSPDNARLLAGAAAIAVAWHFRRTFVTILAGMLALHLFS